MNQQCIQGATEEDCVPVLEKSLWACNLTKTSMQGIRQSESIQGDKEHTVEKDIKSNFRINTRRLERR